MTVAPHTNAQPGRAEEPSDRALRPGDLAEEPRVPLRRALISVFDKTGLVDLGLALVAAEVEIIATGATATLLRAAGVPATDVSEVTGFPEILSGRVKTLHPSIHAGILARDDEVSRSTLAALGITPIDLVVVNLYPFERAVAQEADEEECVEQIDIGGPTLLRAAAKNFARVSTLSDPTQYADLKAALRSGGTTETQRRRWAARAFQKVADYDIAIATWMSEPRPYPDRETSFPDWLGSSFSLVSPLRYGENPHQNAALYRSQQRPDGLATATLLGGKTLSYNNLQDAQAAWNAVADSPHGATVAIVKHTNPCGLAAGESVAQAHQAALACDPLSAFGGVVAINQTVDEEAARGISQVFTEVVVAPDFTAEALQVLRGKKSLRILKTERGRSDLSLLPLEGGMLAQHVDLTGDDDRFENWHLVAGPAVSAEVARDLEFAWYACRYVKSNAIVLVKDEATVGIGMGQVNRVDSAKLAVNRANTLGGKEGAPRDEERARGAVAASDAFFPFPDGLEVLIFGGAQAVVAPGGSRNDPLVIEAAETAGVSLYFTNRRHFRH